MGIVAGIAFILLAIAVPTLLLLFVINPILLRPRPQKGLEPNVYLAEKKENPCPGIELAYLSLVDTGEEKVKENKAFKRLDVNFAPRHKQIALRFVLFCKRKKKKKEEIYVPFDSASFEYRDEKLAKTSSFVFSPKTAAVAMCASKLDDEPIEEAFPIPALRWYRAVLGCLAFGAAIAVSFLLAYLGVISFLSFARLGEIMQKNLVLLLAVFGGVILVATGVSYLVMVLREKRRLKNNG